MNSRVAGKLDLPQIVDIYNQAVLLRWATADLTPVTIASQRQWFREHDPKTWPIWVAEENGAIFGWSSLSAYRSGRMALRYTAEMSYYVDGTQRRKGIASAIWRVSGSLKSSASTSGGTCPMLQKSMGRPAGI